MPRAKQDYTITERRTGRGQKVYYYRIVIDEKPIIKSTGLTNKNEAHAWCKEQYDKGVLGRIENKPIKLTFGQFAGDFFLESCAYVQSHEKKLSPVTLQNWRAVLVNHISPEFKDTLLENINREKIENFFQKKKAELKGGLHVIHAALRLILNRAVILEKINRNPMIGFKCPYVEKKPRGILTFDEVSKLLDPATWETIWNNDKFNYYLNLLCSQTGLRQGEALALRWEDVRDDRVILVRHSWNPMFGIGATKSRKVREVPVTEELYEKLSWLKGEQFLFSYEGIRPLDPQMARQRLSQALERIGVSKAEQMRRGIVFHSWRHFFVTSMRGKIDDRLLRWITGHSSEAMQEIYTHDQYGKLDFDKIRNNIIQFPKQKIG